jgi:GlcNAc-PI de-N-acetylase
MTKNVEQIPVGRRQFLTFLTGEALFGTTLTILYPVISYFTPPTSGGAGSGAIAKGAYPIAQGVTTPNGTYSAVTFYAIAHEDDWQLFMNLNAYYDLVAPNVKVVFINTTAGDEGQGSLYWQSREEGSKSSVRCCLAPLGSLTESAGTRVFNGHPINYWTANNATCYFMRLPDGNIDGNGFPPMFQSLLKLKNGTIQTIDTVDKSAIYNGWSDLYQTIQAIIELERAGIQSQWINYPDTNTINNPGDHSDHYETGNAVQSMGIISTLRQALFVGYNISNNPANLSGVDSFWKSAMFAAYEEAMYKGSGHSTIGEAPNKYIGWCLRSVSFRTIVQT